MRSRLLLESSWCLLIVSGDLPQSHSIYPTGAYLNTVWFQGQGSWKAAAQVHCDATTGPYSALGTVISGPFSCEEWMFGLSLLQLCRNSLTAPLDDWQFQLLVLCRRVITRMIRLEWWLKERWLIRRILQTKRLTKPSSQFSNSYSTTPDLNSASLRAWARIISRFKLASKKKKNQSSGDFWFVLFIYRQTEMAPAKKEVT